MVYHLLFHIIKIKQWTLFEKKKIWEKTGQSKILRTAGEDTEAGQCMDKKVNGEEFQPTKAWLLLLLFFPRIEGSDEVVIWELSMSIF